jgi:MFS transporter, ACS family, hexuronate transporter
MSTAPPALLVPADIYHRRTSTMLLEPTGSNRVYRQVPNAPAPAPQPVMIENVPGHGAIVCAIQAAFTIGIMGIGAILDKLGVIVSAVNAVATRSISATAPFNGSRRDGFALFGVPRGRDDARNVPRAANILVKWCSQCADVCATVFFNPRSSTHAILAPRTAPFDHEVLGAPIIAQHIQSITRK